MADTEYRGKQRWHADCVNNHKGHSKQWAAKPHNKKAWQAKTSEQKRQWFQEMRKHKQLGLKRTYEDAELGETAFKESQSSEMHKDDYLTYDEWYIRGKLLDKKELQIKEDWDEAILDDDHDKKYVNGQWCVHVFRGVAGRRGTVEGHHNYERQSSHKLAADQLDTMREQAKRNLSKVQASLVAQSEQLSSAGSVSRPDESLPQHMVQVPTLLRTVKSVQQTISKDVQQMEAHREYLAKDEAEDEAQAKLDRWRSMHIDDVFLHSTTFDEVDFKEGDWWKAVNSSQVFYCAPGHESIGVLPFCIGEARVVVTGKELVTGLKYSEIPGHSLKERLQWFQEAHLSLKGCGWSVLVVFKLFRWWMLLLLFCWGWMLLLLLLLLLLCLWLVLFLRLVLVLVLVLVLLLMVLLSVVLVLVLVSVWMMMMM
jgi:hypothetical protein